MTFEEAIEIIEDECRVEAEDGFSTKEKDLDTFLALSIIKSLEETYAPKIKMTKKDKKIKSLYFFLKNIVKSYDDLRNTSNGKSDFERNIEASRELLKDEFINSILKEVSDD